jgi:2-oxoglutarate dehydrogenase E1 component
MEYSSFDNINFENIELIEQYLADFENNKTRLDPSWKSLFTGALGKDVSAQDKVVLPVTQSSIKDQNARIEALIDNFRSFGFLHVHCNPLEKNEGFDETKLLQKLGFSEDERNSYFPTCGLLLDEMASLSEIVGALKSTYCSRLGIEFYPFASDEIASWIESRFEPLQGRVPLGKEQKRQAFRKLLQAELFETFLHTKFVGQKRFSLEGAETLIPVLSQLIERAVQAGGQEVVIGMAHRGRLNVLANIFNKPLIDIIAEFHDLEIGAIEGSGDVKYHKGFSSKIETVSGNPCELFMASNPSHLESVDSVLSGYVRAEQIVRDDRVKQKVVPVLIHGDAALSGQGVVYETLELSRLKGYSIGGTIHIVLNNHIGFTTLPEDSRSTRFCTDIAKAFGFPVFHVNAEDVESAVWAVISALELRNQFQTDVFIDLNCYRKYGHNESDEPAFTQPLLYNAIRQKKSILEIFSEKLLQDKIVDADFIKSTEASFRKELEHAFEEVQKKKHEVTFEESTSSSIKRHSSLMKSTDSIVSTEQLLEIGKKVSTPPANFNLHQRLKKNLSLRLLELESENARYKVDWAFAEALAFGSVLTENIPIRLVGQDSRRGTFSQRHAVWFDAQTEAQYVPLQHIQKGQANFEVYDTPISEFATLGFEYGYSLASPKALVLWEAQFGDFANGAEVIIDQYIAAGESKWGAKSNLTLLLPHGYEGQGPEHSSARMERFLQLAAEDNIVVISPSTPSQYFHLLRRQAESNSATQDLRKPLIVFTPKGLLRHNECVSTIDELATSHFETIIDDTKDYEEIERLLFCQGRIYYDLIHAQAGNPFAIIRIEQLYPFDTQKFIEIISRYPHIKEFTWVQEEPYNAGAWSYIHEKIETHLPVNQKLKYIGRPSTASPAVGSHELHAREHAIILESIFGSKKDT